MFDVLIIGGGVIGSAIARELSRYQLKIGVLEKNLDVCNETSGRNSGVVHGGFAYDPGTLKAKLCVEGNQEFDQVAEELDVPFLRCGKVLVGNREDEYQRLLEVIKQGKRNGAKNLRMIDEAELKELVPASVNKFAMYSENSGIVDPFLYTIALAENAAENGVSYYFDHEVTAISWNQDHYEIQAGKETFLTRWVVNSAGLGCAEISEMLGITGYHVIGSKGDYIILDQRTGALLPMPIYPVPSNLYMGIHVTNTTDGNVIIGPNAVTLEDHAAFADYGVTQENIDFLAESASEIWPYIKRGDYIRNYSGILPKWVDEQGMIQDWRIERRDDIAPYAINLIGMESPGLTAALPIARYAINLMKEKEEFQVNPDFNPVRKGIARFELMSEEERRAAIAEDPDYGEVVCRCQKVTKAEILKAIHNPLGVHTMTGIKYRTRSMMGRCQGGYCQIRIEQMIESELNLAPEEVVYCKPGSYVLEGKNRKEGR